MWRHGPWTSVTCNSRDCLLSVSLSRDAETLGKTQQKATKLIRGLELNMGGDLLYGKWLAVHVPRSLASLPAEQQVTSIEAFCAETV